MTFIVELLGRYNLIFHYYIQYQLIVPQINKILVFTQKTYLFSLLSYFKYIDCFVTRPRFYYGLALIE